MKEETSIKRRAGALWVAAIMLLGIFAPASVVSAKTEAGQAQGAQPAPAAAARVGSSKAFLGAPSGTAAKSLGIKTIRIKWNAVEGAHGYQLYRATKKHGKYKRIATLRGSANTCYKNKKRITGKTYYYKVRAYADSSRGAFSKVTWAKARPVQTQVRLKAGEEKIRITWKKVRGAEGYHVYRAKSRNGKYTRVWKTESGKKTRFTNVNLKPGKTYYYKVRAYKKADGRKVYATSSIPVASKAKRIKLKTSKKGFQYKKKFRVKAYAYSGGGKTAMGTKARVGAIAVDPRVIPLGAKVYVEGYGHARAEDTGGNIKGKTIDVYMKSNGACRKWGVQYIDIYVDVKKN